MHQSKITRWGVRLGIVMLLVVLLFILNRTQPQEERGIQVAAAKGQLVAAGAAQPSPETRHLLAVADSNATTAAWLADKRVDFLYAVDMGVGESAEWRPAGCGENNCTHLTYYNYSDGGTIELVINKDNDTVVDQWLDYDARPGASATILNTVLDIASQDEQLEVVLGDIRRARDVMVPMSVWLRDDACRDDWCVDLTFHDPAGSERIFHVVVNLTQEEVARTFYTRGRAARFYQEPPELDPNAPTHTDGCHEQDGWEVCWEMTAHDGLNFYDAKYNGKEIFSSAKIGQVEAFYPSWPGGYRDEIGIQASVPPKFDTRVTEFEDGFEVRQLFTEPFDWPNCVCCYRYEQIIQFYDDGTWEPRFVSHGPGCDAWAEYRPFWRIDVDLEGPEGDNVWVWQGLEWVVADSETGSNLFDNRSLDGAKIVTMDNDLNYRWFPIPTDPLNDDHGRLFIVRYNEEEGDGPIVAGPADTYQPPAGLVDGESASGRNVVIWYVPILKTKKSDPYWCMPDPEPDFSPCEAILKIAPGEELRQPTEAELQQLLALTPTPTVGDSAETPTAIAAIPPTPRPITGETAEEIILNSGCGACHLIGEHGESGKVGPNLSNIGNLAGDRVPGQPAAEYLRNSILYPDLFIAPQCPNGECLAHVMPGDYYLRLTDAQIDTVVAYLQQQTRSEPVEIGDEEIAATATEAMDSAENRTTNSLTTSSNMTLLILATVVAIAVVVAAVLIIRRRQSASTG